MKSFLKKKSQILFSFLFALSCEVKRAYACTSGGTPAHDLHCFFPVRKTGREWDAIFLFFILYTFGNADDNHKALERFFVLWHFNLPPEGALEPLTELFMTNHQPLILKLVNYLIYVKRIRCVFECFCCHSLYKIESSGLKCVNQYWLEKYATTKKS